MRYQFPFRPGTVVVLHIGLSTRRLVTDENGTAFVKDDELAAAAGMGGKPYDNQPLPKRPKTKYELETEAGNMKAKAELEARKVHLDAKLKAVGSRKSLVDMAKVQHEADGFGNVR